jgi:hypothetical protein
MEMEWTISMAQLIAASGMTAVTALNRDPEPDGVALMKSWARNIERWSLVDVRKRPGGARRGLARDVCRAEQSNHEGFLPRHAAVRHSRGQRMKRPILTLRSTVLLPGRWPKTSR